MYYSSVLGLEIIFRGKNRLSRQKGKMVILRSSVVKNYLLLLWAFSNIIIASLSFDIDEMEYSTSLLNSDSWNFYNSYCYRVHSV